MYNIDRKKWLMKWFGYSAMSSLCALILGILLVVWPGVAVIYLVITIGVLFLLPGLWGIFSYFVPGRQEEGMQGNAFPIMALGSALLGVWLIVMPSFFVNIFMYLLGILLVLGGGMQLMNFIAVRKTTGHLPWGVYVIPALILLAGILILVNPFEVATIPFIIMGVSSIIYGLTDLFRLIRYRRIIGKQVTDVDVIDE